MNDFQALMGDDPQNTDKLVPELQLYLYEHPMWGKVLNSPLVQQIPFYSWNHANQSFAHKTEAVAKCVAERRWGQALFWYERPYRLMMLDIFRNQMTHEEYREQLASVWIDAELPAKNHGVTRLVRMFKDAGFVMDSDIVDFESLPSELTVYRGTMPKYKRGMSWTLKLEKAQWFSQRFPQGKVYKTTINKRKILGWFEDRGESEIVLNPRTIGVIEEVADEQTA